jgi:superfamily II DNA or RNA helicase
MDTSDLSLAALATVTASAVSTDALPIELRDYQSDCIIRLRHCYASGHRAPLLCLPTAGAKTVVFAAISYSARRKGKKILVCAHRRELLKQAVAKLAWAGIEDHEHLAWTAVGELAELTPEMVARLQSTNYYTYLAQPRTEAELRAFATARNYHPAWVKHRLREQNSPDGAAA